MNLSVLTQLYDGCVSYRIAVLITRFRCYRIITYNFIRLCIPLFTKNQQYNAMGGPAVLSLLSSKRRVLVIAVEDNRTTMKVDRAAVMALGGSNISNSSKLNGAQVVVARSYAEAAGLLAAHKAGILLESLTDTVKGIPITEL